MVSVLIVYDHGVKFSIILSLKILGCFVSLRINSNKSERKLWDNYSGPSELRRVVHMPGYPVRNITTLKYRAWKERLKFCCDNGSRDQIIKTIYSMALYRSLRIFLEVKIMIKNNRIHRLKGNKYTGWCKSGIWQENRTSNI